MRIDAMITAVRTGARLSDNDADYTAARLRQELTNTQHLVFGHPIVQAKSGAWLKQQSVTTESGRKRYRLPYRACTGVGESVTLGGAVAGYQIIGDQLVFDAAPAAGSTLEWTYYLRPSLLVEEQSAGRVTGKDQSALTVTVASGPVVDRVTSASVTTGDKVDIVHANGWHELSLVGVEATVSGTTFTFPAGTDLTDVEVGDYVRAADQTDWPCIPDDFCECLCHMTGARILRSKGYETKAKALEAQAAADIARFADILQPRIKDTLLTIVPSVGIFGRRRGRFAGNDVFG